MNQIIVFRVTHVRVLISTYELFIKLLIDKSTQPLICQNLLCYETYFISVKVKTAVISLIYHSVCRQHYGMPFRVSTITRYC